MPTMRNYMTEIVLIVVTFFFLLFVTTNSNQSLGSTYILFLVGAVVLLFINLLIFNKSIQVTVKKLNTSNIEELFIAVIAWGVLMVASYVIMNFVDPTKASFGAIMSSLNAANPVFSNSVIVNLLVIALAIPFTETVLWGRGIEFVSDLFHINVNNQNKTRIQFIVILIVFAALFSLFHATAKQLSGQSLLIVFIMMAISIYLIAYRDGDMRAALFLHILANGIAAVLLIKQNALTFNGAWPLLLITLCAYNQKRIVKGLGISSRNIRRKIK